MLYVRHDQSLDRCPAEPILQKDVDGSCNGANEDHELVAPIGAKGVKQAIFWSSIARVDIFAEKWKYEPVEIQPKLLTNAASEQRSEMGATHHVKAKVNQYVIRQATRRTPCGSQMPLEASSATLELEARSMGTRRMILTGRAMARKTGTRR